MRANNLSFFKNCFTQYACLLSLLSILGYTVNLLYTQFPGNTYFPKNAWFAGLNLIIVCCALQYYCRPQSYWLNIATYFTILYSCFALIAFATNSIQFTPFPPIDPAIVRVENCIGINMDAIVTWTASHPNLYATLEWFYKFLTLEMALIPLATLLFGYYQNLMDYVCLLLISCIIGFVFYYFFPTTAPASVSSGLMFSSEQHATGLKFYQLHSYINPTTMAGGMIALPSFHVIWAWFTLRLLKPWPVWFYLFLPVNSIIILSCVLLGWHYPLDVIASVVVIICSNTIYRHDTRLNRIYKTSRLSAD